MRFRIHRGAKQIGGSCVEVDACGQSVLIDLGLPLDCPDADVAELPPTVTQLISSSDTSPNAVLLSHSHPDHCGLLRHVHPSVPIFVGAPTYRLLEASAPFTGANYLPKGSTRYTSGSVFRVGPFAITPFLVDHSAFDAHAFLVEAGERRLFYSGDFRSHGRKSNLMERLMTTPPSNIDALLLEGTVLSRPTDKATHLTEAQLEDRIGQVMRETEGGCCAVSLRKTSTAL